MERAMSAKQNVKKRHADAAGGGILQKRKTEVMADLQHDDLQDFKQPGEALKILEKKAKPPPDSPDALAEAMEDWAAVAELGEHIQKGGGAKVGAKPKGRGRKKEEEEVVEEALKAESMAVEEPEEENMELDEEDGIQESREEEEQDDDQEVDHSQ